MKTPFGQRRTVRKSGLALMQYLLHHPPTTKTPTKKSYKNCHNKIVIPHT